MSFQATSSTEFPSTSGLSPIGSRATNIGTDPTGAIAQPNGFGRDGFFGNGLSFNVAQGATDNIIGGPEPGAGNVISGNVGSGLVFVGGGSGRNVVEGNLIGTQADGTSPLGNTSHGVLIAFSGDENQIRHNTIAFNGGNGVFLVGVGHVVSENSIHSNGGLGIDLAGDGVSLNDTGDGDTGPNNLQNFPVLTSAFTTPGRLVVTGTIDTPNPETVSIEFFGNPVPTPGGDPSGHGEGAVFLGRASPTPGGQISAVVAAVEPGTLISATATDADGNTSEFALNIEAQSRRRGRP